MMEPLFPWLRLSRTANAPLHCLERCATIPSGQTWVGADCSPMLIEEPVIRTAALRYLKANHFTSCWHRRFRMMIDAGLNRSRDRLCKVGASPLLQGDGYGQPRRMSRSCY
jgi:hypothetical protein